MDWETRETYYVSDLFKLCAFFNPYNNDENDLDYLINRVFVTIIKNKHPKNNSEDELNRLYSKIREHVKTSNDKPADESNNGEKYVFDLEKKDIHDWRLNSVENATVRLCIHALLKNDWNIQTRS